MLSDSQRRDSVSRTLPVAVADNVPGNTPPSVASAFNDVTVAEDASSAVDGVASHFSDADGDALTYSVSGFSSIIAVFNGNRISISAPANWNGEETGSVKACDPENACVTTPLKIVYTPVNDAPIINSITITAAQEGQVLAGQMNAADPDLVYGDALTYFILDKTELPELKLESLTGRIYSDAALPFTSKGDHLVRLGVKDLTNTEFSGWYHIVITDVNRAPVITSVDITLAEENQFLLGGINGNDPDGDPVTCYLVSSTLPEAKVSPGCSIYSDVKLPAAVPVNYIIEVGMTDSSLSDTLSKDFEVNRPPTKPTSTCSGGLPCGPNFITDETPFVPLSFTLNSTDPNGDPITYQSGTLPTGATFNPNTGVFSWSPTCSQGGVIYTIGFQSKDDKNLPSTAYFVDITVNDVCPP